MPTMRARLLTLVAWVFATLATAVEPPSPSPFRAGLDDSSLAQQQAAAAAAGNVADQADENDADRRDRPSRREAPDGDDQGDAQREAEHRRTLDAQAREAEQRTAEARAADQRAFDGDWRREPAAGEAGAHGKPNEGGDDHGEEGASTRRPPASRRSNAAQVNEARRDVESAPSLPLPEPSALWDDRRFSLPRLGETLWSHRPRPRPVSLDYRLQPGDLVRVVIWGGARVNQIVPVDAAGDLGVPDHGPIPVAGLTQVEAQARVVELARSFFKNAGAALSVERAQPQAVTVVGEVVSGGALSLPPGGTVLEALAEAGGPLPLGGVRAIRISDGSKPDSLVDLYRLAVDGDAGALTPLPPGAVVFVPQAGPQVQVFGAVRRPACVELKPDDMLAEAIRLAGGVEPFADTDTVRLLREDDAGQRLEHVPLAQLAKMPVHGGDRLLLGPRASLAQGRRTITIYGAVRTSGEYAYSAGMTAADALTAAGGTTPDADFARAIIRRRLAQARKLDLAGGVTVPVHEELVAVVEPTTPLEPLDELVVPRAQPLESQLLTVTIDGEVVRRGEQPLVPDMTVRDLIRLAGGVTPQAELDEADLVRSTVDEHGNRSVRRERVDLRAVLNGDPGPSIAAGDAVVVRQRLDERITVRLSGEVRNAGEFTVPSGTTLGEIIRLAGGLTVHAFPDGAALFRESEKQAAMQHLKDLAQRLESTISINKRQLADAPIDADRIQMQATIANQENELVRMRQAQATGRLSGIHLAEILAGKVEDVPLQRGDALTVPAHPGTVRVLGEIMTPGSIRYERDLKAQLVIQRSGGPTTHADTERIYVVRADGTVVASANGRGTSWSSEERRYVRTSLKSLDLREGDTVIVPPDLRYHEDGLKVAKDVTQIMFQVAAATGTVALLAK